MLHPVEFATSNACTDLNNKFTQLREVFAYGRDKWDFMTFADQKAAITGTATTAVPTASPTLSPTKAPSLTVAPTIEPTIPVTPSPTSSVARPAVSFRLDDVQAWWCEEIVKDVVDEFLAEGVPINLGLIGDTGEDNTCNNNSLLLFCYCNIIIIIITIIIIIMICSCLE